ncbi:hypothetical protein ACI2IY_22175 [Lysobacter enzymogenes]|uniref:hypothetical protein n=1 Tax=Lysobacter enzymogenes TaxID=69 RepID=UPI00384F05F7
MTGNRIAAMLQRTVLAAAKILAAAGVCMLAIWAWMVFVPDCRYAEVEWTNQGRILPRSAVCARDLDVRAIRKDGRDCLELYALKDGLPIGEHCAGPGAH